MIVFTATPQHRCEPFVSASTEAPQPLLPRRIPGEADPNCLQDGNQLASSPLSPSPRIGSEKPASFILDSFANPQSISRWTWKNCSHLIVAPDGRCIAAQINRSTEAMLCLILQESKVDRTGKKHKRHPNWSRDGSTFSLRPPLA